MESVDGPALKGSSSSCSSPGDSHSALRLKSSLTSVDSVDGPALQVGQLIMYYTPKKGITICNLPGIQKPGRNHFPKNSWIHKIYGQIH